MTHNAHDIDLVARAMTAIEPAAHLEARIKTRLDVETLTRPTTGRWPVIAGFAAAAATLIVFVTVRSPEVPQSRGPAALRFVQATSSWPGCLVEFPLSR